MAVVDEDSPMDIIRVHYSKKRGGGGGGAADLPT